MSLRTRRVALLVKDAPRGNSTFLLKSPICQGEGGDLLLDTEKAILPPMLRSTYVRICFDPTVGACKFEKLDQSKF